MSAKSRVVRHESVEHPGWIEDPCRPAKIFDRVEDAIACLFSEFAFIRPWATDQLLHSNAEYIPFGSYVWVAEKNGKTVEVQIVENSMRRCVLLYFYWRYAISGQPTFASELLIARTRLSWEISSHRKLLDPNLECELVLSAIKQREDELVVINAKLAMTN